MTNESTVTERLAVLGFTHARDDLTYRDGRHTIYSGGCPIDRVTAKEAIGFLKLIGEPTTTTNDKETRQ